ncbi:MAG: DNA-directed RNA polymerase subunit beta [Candidatus Parcubacteria bacterium]|nr:MAG: DNA-directed RNA polymerase subunit beta [Candidatus Parcubacteria bacterium]
MNKLEVKSFSHHPGNLTQMPFLAEIQINSWKWFVEKGIKEVFKEISPIRDYTGKEFELYFLDYYFDEPKFSEEESWRRLSTYEAALRAKTRLVNLKTKKIVEQEVYLGDYPIMTERGTFIINGVERVVVSQLIRSPGVYFTARLIKGSKYFGAKIIPDRGSWMEFETEMDGSLTVKIDKHRKVPVSCLLRVFGLETNQKILETFADVDTGELKFIQATLKKDSASDAASSYVEIYRRLRPGDLATPENAKSLIDGMFKREDRFSLSEVGRFKFNERLGINEKVETQLVRLEDLILIVKEIIRLNNDPEALPDDIDSLSNRRVRSVGELLQSRMRVGFARMRRMIQDKMSLIEEGASVTPMQLINPKPLFSVVRDFLVSSQLSQFMDQVNPLSELEHKRRLSAMGPGGLSRERAGFEVRDVHTSHYGRICPIETPEGANIGLINHLATFARVNRLGFLETPYAKVKNGKVTGEIVWMTASMEKGYKIAEGGTPLDKNGRILPEEVEARIDGEPGMCRREEVDFIDVSPYQLVSTATSLIPFLEHDDANRALMGSNMQRQAVPSVRPQVPLVGTGLEEKAARDSGRMVLAKEDGEVLKVDASSIVVKTKSGNDVYELNKFRRSNQYTTINQKPIVSVGQKVKKGQVLADGPCTDNGVLALGQNLLVAFVPAFGGNFEDAIVLSERVAIEDRFTSVYIEDFSCDVRDTKLGPEITTADIPNVSEEKLKNLDEEGIIRIGAEVKAGDILVGKISPKGETELTAEEKLLRSIFGEKARDVKDTSLYLPHGKSGRVVGIRIFSRDRGDKLEPGVIKRIQVEVAQLRKIRAGDKLAGRHGNKGVISQILPVEDMPYLPDGRPVDIVLNPLGVASRMNLGQILETHLGWAAKVLGYRAVTPIFCGATEEEIRQELKKAGLPEDGKTYLYDGRTGRRFEDKITVGYIYMLKLNHLVEDKIHMRSIGPYSLVTQQPLGGKAQFGGQRFGEMEVWALEGYGAAHTLQEMITIKSDDVLGRASAFESIVKGEDVKISNSPSAFNVLVSEINSLGLKIEPLKKEDVDE